MPRHPEHQGQPYQTVISVKLNPEALAVLDRLRGKIPRSTYLRDLLRAQARREKDHHE